MTTLIHMFPLLESLGPVAVQVVRLLIDEIIFAVRKRTVTRGTGEAAGMPVTIQGQQTGVDQGLETAGTFRIVLVGETGHAVRVVVGRLKFNCNNIFVVF